MRILVIIILFYTWTNFAFGQTTDSLNQRKWTIKFAPANLVDPINPSVQLGIERRVSVNNSVQVEFGYILPSDLLYQRGSDSSVFPNYHGLKARIEFRQDLNTCGEFITSLLGNSKGIYLAIELMYTHNKYNSSQGYHNPTDTYYTTTAYNENVKIDRQVWGLNWKIGMQQYIGRFVMEGYVGIGVKYKMVKHLGRSNYNDEWTPSKEPNIYSSADKPGNYWTGNLPVNIKVGYMF